MNRRVPEHGEWARYLGCKSRPPCRCDVCVIGARRIRKRKEVSRARGVEGLASQEMATAHLRRLVKSGRSLQGIADETGVCRKTVAYVHAGNGRPIRATTAGKLLRARSVQDPKAMVDASGTVRRLRALVVMGHSQKTLAAEMPCAFTAVSMLTHGVRSQVTTATDQAVRSMYGRLSMVQGPSRHGQKLAARYGWHGPLAWDDDTIDDPAAVPQTDAPEAGFTEGDNVVDRWLLGESVVLDQANRRAVLAHLMEWSPDDVKDIAERLGMSLHAVEKAWERIKGDARNEGRAVPWRRRYVPLREKNMTRYDMRSAA